VPGRQAVARDMPFKTALLGKGGSGLVAKEVLEVRAKVNVELSKELKGSMVGTLSKEKDVRRIQTTLFMEGFKSISVTNMGGNMVIIRSPVEGDVGRLLRSKNECLDYFFSEVKPWSPGLLAVQREVWIQVFGIPLHIWGDDFFKLLGTKLGVFLDYDFETESMARFDVARLKILSNSWAIIDTVVKVEVEGKFYHVWVVEERGRQRASVVLGDEVEEAGSEVVPSEASGAVDEGYVGGGGNSGEDDSSEPEVDGDMQVHIQYGGSFKENKDRPMGVQVHKEGKGVLTSEKSNIVPISNGESPAFVPAKVCGETVTTQVAHVSVLPASKERVGDDIPLGGGPANVGEREVTIGEVDSGPNVGDVSGHSKAGPDPAGVGSVVLGLNVLIDPTPSGAEVDDISRLSTLSEPEEVLHSFKTKNHKQGEKPRRQKARSKFYQVGVPKCIQLVEAVQEGCHKARRRRLKEGAEGLLIEKQKGADDANLQGGSEAGGESRVSQHQVHGSTLTPTSGINLLSVSGDSCVPETQLIPTVGVCGGRWRQQNFFKFRKGWVSLLWKEIMK
jgi:hypothetical protein